jgi:hypothetical protein
MQSYGVSAVIGAFVSWLLTGSASGFVALSLLSVLWGVVLTLVGGGRKQWMFGVFAYCSSVMLFSSSLRELYEMTQKGFYRAVLGELPEMFLMVVLLPLLAVVAAQLFRMVTRD